VPTRADLARTLRRVADSRWPLSGASDHLVSEALYLADPEGNGIELYRDRPRDEWPRSAGSIEMATLPLDLESLLGEPGGERAGTRMPAGTTLGHVHLQVADLGDAEAFWVDALGFDVTVRGYPAPFVSAGGYHHHVGLNTWAGVGAPSPPSRLARGRVVRGGASGRGGSRGGSCEVAACRRCDGAGRIRPRHRSVGERRLRPRSRSSADPR
jgi:catechol 2,3-dioxygenase